MSSPVKSILDPAQAAARVSHPAAPPFRPDPDLISNAEGDDRAQNRTVAAARAARSAEATTA